MENDVEITETQVRRKRTTVPKSKTVEQSATVTVDLLQVVGLLNVHDTRLTALEREQKDTREEVREIKTNQVASQTSLNSVESKLIGHIDAMNVFTPKITTALETLADRVEGVVTLQGQREKIALYVEELQNKEVLREKELKERTKFQLEQARLADERHQENTRRLNTLAPFVLVFMGNVAARNLQVPVEYQQIFAVVSLVVGALYYIWFSFYSGPLRKSRKIHKELNTVKEDDS